jgi:hypothetical protein
MTGPVDNGGNPANPAGGGVSLFTQEQVNAIAANTRREALTTYFKDLGLNAAPEPNQLKDVLDKATKFDQIQQGQKGDVERLTTELATEREKAGKVPTLEAELHRARLAADAGLKPRYWKYVEGDNDDAIKASIQEVLTDVRGGGEGGGTGEGEPGDEGGDTGGQEQQQQQRRGTGASPLTPNPQQGAGGGGRPAKSMSAGADAYKAKHNKE